MRYGKYQHGGPHGESNGGSRTDSPVLRVVTAGGCDDGAGHRALAGFLRARGLPAPEPRGTQRVPLSLPAGRSAVVEVSRLDDWVSEEDIRARCRQSLLVEHRKRICLGADAVVLFVSLLDHLSLRRALRWWRREIARAFLTQGRATPPLVLAGLHADRWHAARSRALPDTEHVSGWLDVRGPSPARPPARPPAGLVSYPAPRAAPPPGSTRAPTRAPHARSTPQASRARAAGSSCGCG